MAKELKYLFFDAEMSGSDQLVSIGYIVTNAEGETLSEDYFVVKPKKKIRKSTIAIHGITTEQAKKEGIPLKKALGRFINAAKECSVHVGFAPQNDILAFAIGWRQLKQEVPYEKGNWTIVDVARLGEPYMLERGKISQGQTPSLCNIYTELFDGEQYDQHNALSDAKATARCFWKLMRDNRFTFNAIVPFSKLHQLCHPKPHKPSNPAEQNPDETAETADIAPSSNVIENNISTTPDVDPIAPKKKKRKRRRRKLQKKD